MNMKKFINAPETITDEELVGLGLAYPDILDVDGHLVISKDLADADRVTTNNSSIGLNAWFAINTIGSAMNITRGNNMAIILICPLSNF